MKENIFEQIDSNNKAYWLGFLSADGSIKNNELSIGLANKDREHLIKFLKFIDSKNSIIDTMSHCTNNNKYYPSSHINIYSIKLINDLKKYNIVSNKSYQNINFLSNIPKEYFDPFIIGYFDGDGWFTFTEKSHGFGFCGNEKTIIAIRDYLFSLYDWNLSILNYSKSKITYYIQGQSFKRIQDFINLYLSYSEDCDLLERKKNIAINLKTLISQTEIKERKKISFKICPYCGKEYLPSYSEQKYCSYECSAKGQQKVKRPTRKELKFLIRNTSFLEIGRIYGVSDNAIRKWCDRYNLPRKATDIKKISNEEWKNI